MKSMLRLVLVAILVSRELVSRVQAQKDPLKNTPSGKTSKVGTTKEPKRLISLAESMNITQRSLTDPDVLKIRRQYWEATLADIRKMTNYPSTTGSTTGSSMIGRGPKATVPPASPASIPSSTTTTAFSDEASSVSSSSNISLVDSTVRMEDKDGVSLSSTPTAANSLTSSRFESPRPAPPRFEGFPSWERMLQDWSEDIQDYVDQASEDSEAGYSMGNYGRPAASSWTETNNKTSWSFLSSPDTDQQQPLPLSPSLASSGIDLDNTASQPDESVNLTNKSLIVSKSKVSTSTPLSPIIITPEPLKEGEDVLPHTDLSDLSKRILIVTTASLPWKTGTAVNPLLRAAYLATPERSNAGGNVTLLVPWLERQDDQTRVYGASNTFETAEDQDTYIRTWLRDSAGMTHASTELNIAWYTAWQNKVENSIYSMGDITAIVSADEIDICILEEPEHLNWYRAPGESWTKKYKHVVGILHTNYFSYALDQPAALIRAPAMRLLCSWMCRAHCHRVIKLSGTLDKVAPEKELVENVHGVRGTFLTVGETVRGLLISQDSIFNADAEPKVYFIGKMLWSKGLGSLMELLKYAEESASLRVQVNMYGGGPDMNAAAKKAEKLNLDMPFRGPLDHAELAYTQKIFVNPSTSEVLCTTSAEALAMGKFVIIPSHPSNDFFAQFPNCLTYASKEEFVGELYYAMTHAPEPLSEEFAYALSWEAATQRLMSAACIPTEEFEKMQDALASADAGIEIALPPLVESEESRKEISKVFRFSRLRYRQFRTRLSVEIQENKVLPKSVRDRLVAELDKRLELNIDEFLDSPKLRLKLSPAELDKSLLELYDNVSESPGGDILRLIGGGGAVAMQNLYMRRHAERDQWRNLRDGIALDIFPTYVDDIDTPDDKEKTVTQMIRRSLRRNIPQLDRQFTDREELNGNNAEKSQTTPRMCCIQKAPISKTFGVRTWSGLRPIRMPPRRSSIKLSILI